MTLLLLLLHELGHGLGFIENATYDNATGIGEFERGGRPYIYSSFVEDSDGTSVTSLPDSSLILGEFFTSNDLFMTGENTVEAFEGEEPKLFAPPVWNQGSSYVHWDEASFPAGDPNSLMTPFTGFAEANHRVGDITKGLFKDIGWTLNEEPVTLISLRHTARAQGFSACSESVPTTDEIGVVPGKSVCLYYTVTNEGDIPLTLHNLRDTESGVIFFNVEQDLAPGESFTVSRQIWVRPFDLPLTNIATWTASQPGVTEQVSATAVVKLFYAPVANISPGQVSVRLKPDTRRTRSLNIFNLGGTPLTYRTVIRETARPFKERVNESQAAVAQLNATPSVVTPGATTPGATNEASSMAGLIAAQISGKGTFSYQSAALKAVQFATDFESFGVGPLGTQNGWFATDTLAQISGENPFSGDKHLRLLSDAAGSGSFYSVFSPLVKGGAEPYSSFSMKLSLNGGAQYFIIPSQETDGQLTPAGDVLISSDRRVFVFDIFSSAFVFTGYLLPEGYVELKFVSNRLDDVYDLYIDDQLIAEDIATPPNNDVDIVEVLHVGGTGEGSLDIDDIELIDGDATAPDWVFVEPAADTVGVRALARPNIIFDSEGLEPGVYKAEITILTNDPFNPSFVVPVKMTVRGSRAPVVELPYLRELQLVNARTNHPLKSLSNGDVLDLSALPAITLEATTIQGDFRGRVDFLINGRRVQHKNIAPYALGDNNMRGNYSPYHFAPGTYEVTAVAVVQGSDGQEQTDSLSVNIRVVEGDQSRRLARSDQGPEGANINPNGLNYQAYPNPVTQKFIVRSQTSAEPIAHYTLIDNLGRILVAKSVDHVTTLEVDMTSHLSQIRSSGIFYLRLMTTEGHSETMRLQVE